MNACILVHAGEPLRSRAHGGQRHIGGGVACCRPVEGERLRRAGNWKRTVFAGNRLAVSRLIGAARRFDRNIVLLLFQMIWSLLSYKLDVKRSWRPCNHFENISFVSEWEDRLDVLLLTFLVDFFFFPWYRY